MKTYIQLVLAGSAVFFLFAFGLSYGNRLAMYDKVGLPRDVMTHGISKEVAETTKIVAEANKVQAEADAITSASVSDFAKNVVVLAIGSVFVVFLMFLAVIAMSSLGKATSDE